MSVVVLGSQEIGTMAITAVRMERIHGGIFEDTHILEIKEAGETNVEQDDCKRSLILQCFNRLYLANQMAYMLNYGTFTVPIPLVAEDFEGNCYLNRRDYLTHLQMLRYNLFTNGGNTMASAKDERMLDNVIHMVMTSIIGRE